MRLVYVYMFGIYTTTPCYRRSRFNPKSASSHLRSETSTKKDVASIRSLRSEFAQSLSSSCCSAAISTVGAKRRD